MMLAFEWKKLWRKKTVLQLFVFSVILVGFINYRSARLAIDEEYRSYGSVPADAVFMSNFSRAVKERYNQKKSTVSMNKDWRNLEEETSQMFVLYRSIPSDFVGYSEQTLELERLYMYALEKGEELLKKYEVPLNVTVDDQDTWEWAIFEMQYAKKHGVHTMSGGPLMHLSNAVRRVIFNSHFLFGWPIMLCLIFLFSGIMSEEREQHTAEFLSTQPISKSRILLSKMGAMWSVAILYLLFLGVLLWGSFRWIGLPMDGLREIYRVIDPVDSTRHVVAYQLLGKILLGYLLMVTFFSSIIFFVSVYSKDTMTTLACMVIFFMLLFVLTKNFYAFQRPWNPIFALDYLWTVNGRIWDGLREDLTTVCDRTYGSGMKGYFFFGGVAVLFFVLSLTWDHRAQRHPAKQRNFSSRWSLGRMERMKIFQTKGFLILLIGAVALLFLSYLPIKWEDDRAFQKTKSTDDIELYEKELKNAQMDLERAIKRQKSMSDPDAKNVQVDREDFIDSHERWVRFFESKLSRAKAGRKYLWEKDGIHYYELQEKTVKEEFDAYEQSPEFVREQPSPATLYESKAIMKKASEENVTPIISSSLTFSAYEEYKNLAVQKQFEKRNTRYSHSAFYLPYRLLKEQRTDLAFLVLVILMSFGGYVFDKEHGNQLEFMYTEPVRRSRYHWMKIGMSVVVSAGLFLLFFAFLFVLGGVSEGVGAWNFPVVEHLSLLSDPFQASEREVLDSISLIPLWRYLLRVFVVLMAECFFLSSLSTLLSVFTKKKNRLLAGLALLVGGGVFLSGYLPQGTVRVLSPFQYLQASTVANGSVMIFRHLSSGSFWRSVFILVVWGVVLGAVGARIVKKRECV